MIKLNMTKELIKADKLLKRNGLKWQHPYLTLDKDISNMTAAERKANRKEYEEITARPEIIKARKLLSDAAWSAIDNNK